MSKSDKTELREARVRSKLKKAGFSLRKPRFRNPELRNFYAGYMIIHDDTNSVAAGAWPREFSLTIEEVEQFLLAP